MSRCSKIWGITLCGLLCKKRGRRAARHGVCTSRAKNARVEPPARQRVAVKRTPPSVYEQRGATRMPLNSPHDRADARCACLAKRPTYTVSEIGRRASLRRNLAQLHEAHVTGKIMQRRRQVGARCRGYERAARRITYGNMATARVWPRWQGRGRCICRYMRMDSDANSSTAVLQWEWHVSHPLLETPPCAIL